MNIAGSPAANSRPRRHPLPISLAVCVYVRGRLAEEHAAVLPAICFRDQCKSLVRILVATGTCVCVDRDHGMALIGSISTSNKGAWSNSCSMRIMCAMLVGVFL